MTTLSNIEWIRSLLAGSSNQRPLSSPSLRCDSRSAGVERRSSHSRGISKVGESFTWPCSMLYCTSSQRAWNIGPALPLKGERMMRCSGS